MSADPTGVRTTTKAAVCVIGLGPMGQAMVRALMAGGHPVTVWNRTASRADDLVAEGATRAATPAEAIAACDVVIVSLTDYQAMYDVLGPVVDGSTALANPTGVGRLAGRTLVNLSSDTPQRSREASAWATGHGAEFVTGGVMIPAPMVGTDSAYVYYSGPARVVETYEPMLGLIGTPRYLGEDPGLAQLLYQAQLDVFLTALSGLLHATALVSSAGISAAEFVPEALTTLAGIPAMLEGGAEVAKQLDAGEHPGSLSTTTMMGATADHIVSTSAAAGVDLALPRAIKSHYDRAVAAGHGNDNWTSLFEVIR